MLAVAVLAAGKGTRMKSDLPKVLQPLAGATLVERVLGSCRALEPQRQILIVGHQAERVEQSLSQHAGLEFVLQQPQNGTGHAVQQLLAPLADFEGDLLVLNGDVPLLRQETITALLEQHRSSQAAVTLLTARLADPTGYGRVFADASGQVSAIVEHRDCSEEQRANTLTNAGIYCFNWKKLAAVLPQLSTDNDQGELYLTDTVAMLNPAMHLEVADADEINGINDRYQLAQCEAVIQQRLRRHWMAEGVTFVDPDSCTLSDGTRFGRDVVVEPQCHFRGSTTIGRGCRIGERVDSETVVRAARPVEVSGLLVDGHVVGLTGVRPLDNVDEADDPRVDAGQVDHLQADTVRLAHRVGVLFVDLRISPQADRTRDGAHDHGVGRVRHLDEDGRFLGALNGVLSAAGGHVTPVVVAEGADPEVSGG